MRDLVRTTTAELIAKGTSLVLYFNNDLLPSNNMSTHHNGRAR